VAEHKPVGLERRLAAVEGFPDWGHSVI
jgi:hypothetical protein